MVSRRSWAQLFAGIFVVASTACSGPNTGSSDPDAGEAGDGSEAGGEALDVQTTLVSGNPDQVTVVANPAGGVFVAGLTSALVPYIASFDAELAPVWMKSLVGISAPRDLVIDGSGRIVLSAGQSGGGAVVRFDTDGTLIDGVKVDGAEPRKLIIVDDGTIVTSGGFALDDNLAQVLELEGRGEYVAATSDGGFVFASATELGDGTSGTGVVLRKVNGSGALQWRSFASPGPGIHAMIGVRELSDGRFLAAVSNDAADTRNVASGSALLTFTFDASGQLESSQSVRFTRTEDAVPLLSGGALGMASRGDETFVGLIANSGGLGSDARTQPTVELDTSGTPIAISTIGGGAAVGPQGDLYLMNFGGRLSTASELRDFCGDGISFAPSPFDAQASFQPAGETVPVVVNIELSPIAVTVEPADLPESNPSLCGG